jgi:hypothetical protein
MTSGHVPWHLILLGSIKLLKTFGLIPGAIAAFGLRKLFQKLRQKRAIAGWPATEATIQSAKVHQEGVRRYWAEITYTYYVGEYRAGTYLRRFRKEDDADEFVRQLRDKRIQVRYKDSDPDNSVILDRDIEMVALLTPQLR